MAITNVIKLWGTSEYLNKTALDFSLYVCEKRGIPSIGDGLKDGQRKALYLLYNKKGETKTISHAGEMISSGLYLHGDIAAADSIGMLAAPYLNNVPLIQGIGTFGTTVSPYDIAAPRYTYVTKNKNTSALIYPDFEIVPMVDNYDGSTKEPKHFLPLVPLVLLNGVKGMGVGYATDIFPRNIQNLIKSVVCVLDNKEIPEALLNPVYEFCSAGNAVNLGPNKWEFHGVVKIQDTSTLVVTALPPGTNREKFVESLMAMEESDKIREYIDESAEFINITIKLPRGLAKDWTESNAIEFLKLHTRQTENLVVIGWDGNIKPYQTPVELVHDFVNTRLSFFKERYLRLLAIEEKRLVLNRLFECCFLNNISGIINQLQSKKEVVDLITMLSNDNSINATTEQIEYCATLPLYRWAKDELVSVRTNIATGIQTITTYKDIIADDSKLRGIYKKEVQELGKYKFDTGR